MKRIAIYLRVSTSHQTTDLQENDLIDYASQRKFQIYKIYSDIGISGAKEKRPSLDQLMNDARKRLFEVVLVWKFDRFARSTKHLSFALDEFHSLGIDFISYHENIDTSSPMGRAMFTIISAMAQLEREIIRERVVAGISAAKKKGILFGRPKSRNDLQIIKLREQGLSFRAIAKQLGVSLGSVQAALKSTFNNEKL